MDLFPIYFTQNRYFCFYFFSLTFYFVPSLGKSPSLLFCLSECVGVRDRDGAGGAGRRGGGGGG